MATFPSFVYRYMITLTVFLLFVVSMVSLSGIFEEVSLQNALLVPRLPQNPGILDFLSFPWNLGVWLFQLSLLDFGIGLLNLLLLSSISIIGVLMLIEIIMEIKKIF